MDPNIGMKSASCVKNARIILFLVVLTCVMKRSCAVNVINRRKIRCAARVVKRLRLEII
jgi:hypothetical protein